jgi:hypothetical protein
MSLETQIHAALSRIGKATITEIYMALGQKVRLESLNRKLSILSREGKITRVSRGLYRL